MLKTKINAEINMDSKKYRQVTWLFMSVVAVEGLNMTVFPKIAYEGEFKSTIRCEVGSSAENVTRFGWLQILRRGDVEKERTFLTMYSEGDPVWGSRINADDDDSRMWVNWNNGGELESYFLEVNFNQVACKDSGRYTCLFFASEGPARSKEDMIHDELIVYTMHGHPKITNNGKEILDKELRVIPGEYVTLKCTGPVGKPHVPMFWYQYNPQAAMFIQKVDNISYTSVFLPDDDLCSYHGETSLTIMASLVEPEMTFKCQIGVWEDYVTVVVENGWRRNLFYNCQGTLRTGGVLSLLTSVFLRWTIL